MEQPLVSIIMPSYNTPSDFLHEAIKSVLTQTYTNFELLIFDDGSNPSVKSMISDIRDSRIRIICNSENKGLSYSLNNGLVQSLGKYIFRMDSDDICNRNRLRRQVEFLEENPNIDVVSTFARTFGTKNLVYKSATQDSQIKSELLWKNPLVHPTVAIRAETIRRLGIRFDLEAVSEDFEIWSRMAFEYHCKFAVIPEELLNYRIHSGQITATKKINLQKSESRILQSSFHKLGIQLSKEDMDIYNALRIGSDLSHHEVGYATAAMKKILDQIAENISKEHLKRIYRKQILRYCLKKRKYFEIFELVKIR